MILKSVTDLNENQYIYISGLNSGNVDLLRSWLK